MRNTNRLCREWLIQNNYDYIWFKPHMDTRKNKFKEIYYTKQGNFYQTDLYNLFDGICFDVNGILTFIQTTTTKWHPEGPYQKFMSGKKGFKILMLRARKVKHRWTVETKLLRSKSEESSQCGAQDVIPNIQPIG